MADRQSEPEGEDGSTGGTAQGLCPRRIVGLVLGPLGFIIVVAIGPAEGLSPAGQRTAAVALWMAIWWIAEAIPLPATALLPLILLPVLGVVPAGGVAASYSDPILFLFLGGFVIALAMERWQLHRRIALLILRVAGGGPAATIAGFMSATAFLSMWVSNTATAMMMTPIALSVIALHGNSSRTASKSAWDGFAVAALLGIAYAANIGGLATLIGTPPNALLAAYLGRTYDIRIGFGEWMLLGVPVMLALLPVCWLLLTRVLFRMPPVKEGFATRASIAVELSRLGRISREEALVATVFIFVAAAWILRPTLERWIPGLSDAGIAIVGAVLTFVIPSRPGRGVFLMNWEWAQKLPWGILLLFGGGLALANAMDASGLAAWTGERLAALAALPPLLIVLAAVALVVFLTELTSNTATAASFLPIAGPLAVSFGMDPSMMAVPVALAASCAFMMPVATPPNAIVFGSGHVAISHMIRAGIWMNVTAIIVLIAAAYLLVPLLFAVAP